MVPSAKPKPPAPEAGSIKYWASNDVGRVGYRHREPILTYGLKIDVVVWGKLPGHENPIAPNIRTTRAWEETEANAVLDHAAGGSVKRSRQPHQDGTFIAKTWPKRHQLAVVRFSRVDNPRGSRKTNRRRIVSDRCEGGNFLTTEVIPQFTNPEPGGNGRQKRWREGCPYTSSRRRRRRSEKSNRRAMMDCSAGQS